MMAVKFKVLPMLFFLVIFSCGAAYAQGDGYSYKEARSAARSGQPYFAFLHFRGLVNDYPESKFAESALFAVGEYYYSAGDYRSAGMNFEKFVSTFPRSKGLIFALAYLAQVCQKQNNPELAKSVHKEIIRLHQASLLFRDYKEYKYKSAFFKTYKARHFIDKIEFYIDNELFEKISF